MRGVLEELLSSIYASNNEDGNTMVSSIWVSADESAAVSSALAPKLRQAEEGVERLLFEVVTLQVFLSLTPAITNHQNFYEPEVRGLYSRAAFSLPYFFLPHTPSHILPSLS